MAFASTVVFLFFFFLSFFFFSFFLPFLDIKMDLVLFVYDEGESRNYISGLNCAYNLFKPCKLRVD